MASQSPAKRFAGPRARLATVLLLTAQLGGCAIDLVSEQAVLRSLFCTAAVGRDALEWIAALTWLVLAFSWIVGLTALRHPLLRPAYWSLLLLIPAAFAAQSWLLDRQILYCDGP